MHYAWIIASTGTLVLLLTQGFGRMSYAVILPSMKNGLSLSYTQVGLIGTANFIGYLGLAVIGGFLAVRFSARRMIFISLVVMGISLFLTGFSQSFAFAFLMRFVTGMGNGGAVVPMMGLTASWFAARKRGLAAGILTAGTGIGLSVVGLTLPYLINKFGPNGWRYAWCSIGATVFALSFFCYAFLRDTPHEKGTTAYGGEKDETRVGATSFFGAWKDVVKEREVWKLGIVYFMFGFSYIVYMTFFIAYLTNELGVSPQRAGEIFAVLGFFSIVSGVVWGWISDVLGRRLGLLFAFVALAMSCLVFAFWRTTPGFYASSVAFGSSLSSIPSIMAAAAGDAMGRKLAPAALGFITLIFGIGQSIGPAVAGWMKDATGTFIGCFVLAAAVCLLGAAGSLMLRKKA